MTEENKPQILTINMVPAGVDLVIAALAKLPYEQTAPLIEEIRGQAIYQMQQQPVSDAVVLDNVE